MDGSGEPEDRFPSANAEDAIPKVSRTSAAAAAGAAPAMASASRALEDTELDSALQLLVERAQYITGATGTALALPQGEEMVCRASAGSCAPEVGARLQVRSGLTGESIARRQLLLCDNAETDPRVNLEACRALGIASIVVLPLLRRSGVVRGLFELFSDHPYAFEERDLIALERMADLTLTALDLAEQSPKLASAPVIKRESDKPVETLAASSAVAAEAISPPPESSEPAGPTEPAVPVVALPVDPEPATASVPEAMLRVQRCVSCGFPVSEGRTLCLDCENKDEQKQRQRERQDIKQREQEQGAASDSEAPTAEESVPGFLASYEPAQESWLARHVKLLAIIVLIVCIVVAVMVFR